MDKTNLHRLFHPKRIALIGASGDPRKWGFIVLLNILKGNFSGQVYPVNPHQDEILGYSCHVSVVDIPDPIDVAVITTPAVSVAAIIEECGQKQIPFVIVITADFSETGPEGARMERDIVARAKKHDIRLVGPNSMGLYCAAADLHAMMPPPMPLKGKISMFSQSGNIGVQMLAWGLIEGVGFGKFVSSGNEGDLTCLDYLRYFAEDNDTHLVLGYLEGIDPKMDFIREARAVTQKKPFVVLKGGRTNVGSKAAASHSGAMAGESKIYSAAFRQAGMIEVKTSQAMMDCAKAFSHYPVIRGKRVGIITRGGGWGVITADVCQENGLDVPSLSSSLVDEFDGILPKYWSRSNPVDLVATITYDPYITCLEKMAAWEGVDAIIALGAGRGIRSFPFSEKVDKPKALVDAINMMTEYFKQRAEKPDKILLRIKALVRQTQKPIVAVSIGTDDTHREILEEFDVLSYPTPERAVRVLRHMYTYYRYLESTHA
jgi:acyl-CoA synthetase (NDP forming)